MGGTTRQDPFGGYSFLVQIDGLASAAFKTVSGLDSTAFSVPRREGTDATLSRRQVPEIPSYSNITLTHGIITNDSRLWPWRQDLVDGTLNRKTLSIVLCDDSGTPRIRWDLANAWPTKWTGPSIDAGADAVAIETLELAHEGVTRQEWS
jgi:phage tail-like protein